MIALLAIFACGAPESAATPGSPSAKLAERAGALSTRSRDVAARAEALATRFDELRALPPSERGPKLQALREEVAAIEELAREVEAEVAAIEASAQVW